MLLYVDENGDLALMAPMEDVIVLHIGSEDCKDRNQTSQWERQAKGWASSSRSLLNRALGVSQKTWKGRNTGCTMLSFVACIPLMCCMEYRPRVGVKS